MNQKIINVNTLLLKDRLALPSYQRPYKWTVRHVNQLFADITAHRHNSSYRLGTIVFHHDADDYENIVDGQQRTVTVLLIVRALVEFKMDRIEHTRLKEQLAKLASARFDPVFGSEISQANIFNNYRQISRVVRGPDFTEDHINFFLNRCEFVTFTLKNIAEAFQFFDSQNARGRELDPHDLLKAFHLREFPFAEQSLKVATVSHWENSEARNLASLFGEYLYRIRNWSKGVSARHFSKGDIHLFKGINLNDGVRYPYGQQLRVAHYYVDEYNGALDRRIDGHAMDFPFSLDQTVINGRRFFEMTRHYQDKISQVKKRFKKGSEAGAIDGLGETAGKILDTINSYPERGRIGDRYVRIIFDCLLVYYIDRFGVEDISRSIEKIFIWAYSLRLEKHAIKIEGMDNHVLNGTNFFRVLRDATRPEDFIDCALPTVAKLAKSSPERIVDLFKEMKYYA